MEEKEKTTMRRMYKKTDYPHDLHFSFPLSTQLTIPHIFCMDEESKRYDGIHKVGKTTDETGHLMQHPAPPL